MPRLRCPLIDSYFPPTQSPLQGELLQGEGKSALDMDEDDTPILFN